MAAGELGIEEIVQSIRRSQVPTLVCEGKEDLAIYRHIEERLGPTSVGALPCGGRVTLLGVYDRREEFAGKRVVFFADRDMWLYSEIPPEYKGILFTNGYSLENDILNWENIEGLMTKGERTRYETARRELAKWIAFQVEKYLNGEEYSLRDHVRRVIDMRTGKLAAQYCDQKGYRNPNQELVTRIGRNYRAEIRGKTLIELALVFLSSTKRQSKYSRENLVEMSLRVGFNRGLEDSIARIGGVLGFPSEELRV